jgi:tetratricopeptide (TPR) repeat protein
LSAQNVPAKDGTGSPAEPKKPPPTFHAAGVQGNIAPSGYSAGAREEEALQIASLVGDLQAANYADELPVAAKLSCDRQPELLHAVLTQPTSFEANLSLGLFYLQHPNPGLSVKYLSLARDLKPSDPDVQRYLATADMEAKDYASASRLAAQWIDAHQAGAGSAETHRIKGSVEAAAGNTDAALAEFKQSVALDPDANHVFSAGLSVMALGLFADAEQLLVSGLEAHPKSAKLWLAKGMAEVLEQNHAQAIESLLRAAALDPSDLLAPTLLATQADSVEAVARVLPIVRSLALARPGEAVAHYDYALVLSRTNLGASEASIDVQVEAELRTAIKEQPQFASAHFELGVFDQKRGDEKSAIAEISEAVRLDPTVAEWRYRLARAYRVTGQTAAAGAQMQAFQQLTERRNAGADVSARLLDGLPPGALGVGASCPVGRE